MKEKCVFTICARNYLAQALTLKDSVERNCNVDFYIFLADMMDSELINKVPNIVCLDDNFIHNWKNMAFKYNVIEFSTSIKPFCFKKLFKEYTKVLYLDPDIYVTSDLSIIYDKLDNYDIVITPHYNNIMEEFLGTVSEETFLLAGIYNLGFVGIKNSCIGNKIINWWMNRLENKCYADKHNGLFVDQKWIDFIPAFFPNNVLIFRHYGLNVAVWNLHERNLIVRDRYYVFSNNEAELVPLIFFHFSGFDPFNSEVFNRRHPEFNTTNFPHFEELIEEYKQKLYLNGYDVYSKINYSFNSFSNGKTILPINRRLYRVLSSSMEFGDPFISTGEFYKLMERNKLISKYKENVLYEKKMVNGKEDLRKKLFIIFKFIKKLMGCDRYNSFLSFLNGFSEYEQQINILDR